MGHTNFRGGKMVAAQLPQQFWKLQHPLFQFDRLFCTAAYSESAYVLCLAVQLFIVKPVGQPLSERRGGHSSTYQNQPTDELDRVPFRRRRRRRLHRVVHNGLKDGGDRLVRLRPANERPDGRQERDVRLGRNRARERAALGLAQEELHDVRAHPFYLACLGRGRGRADRCCCASGAGCAGPAPWRRRLGGGVPLGRQGEEGRELAEDEVEVLEGLLGFDVSSRVWGNGDSEGEVRGKVREECL